MIFNTHSDEQFQDFNDQIDESIKKMILDNDEDDMNTTTTSSQPLLFTKHSSCVSNGNTNAPNNSFLTPHNQSSFPSVEFGFGQYPSVIGGVNEVQPQYKASSGMNFLNSAPSKLVCGGLFFFDNDPYKQLSSENNNSHRGERDDVAARNVSDVCKQLFTATSTGTENYGAALTGAPPGVFDAQIPDNVFWLARDHYGCRLLQKQLESNNRQFAANVFEKVIPSFVDLMIDPFGNYFCQKLMDHCDASQTERITTAIRDQIYEIALNLHGTRALQKLIESPLSNAAKTIISDELRRDVVLLVQDANGNHVVQKVLIKFEPRLTDFIYDELVQHFASVATNKHGCCVLQRALDHGAVAQAGKIVDSVVRSHGALVQDQFGNYVVQYVLEMPGFQEQKIRIGEELLPNSMHLARQKFASNVIEKCILHNLADFRRQFCRALQKGDSVVHLLLDKFANYVVQRCITLAEEEDQTLLLETIKSKGDILGRDDFGQKILTKLTKQYSKQINEGSNSTKGAQSNKKDSAKKNGASNYNGGTTGVAASGGKISQSDTKANVNHSGKKSAAGGQNRQVYPLQQQAGNKMTNNVSSGGKPSWNYNTEFPPANALGPSNQGNLPMNQRGGKNQNGFASNQPTYCFNL